jgi:signal transduction histidine kinase
VSGSGRSLLDELADYVGFSPADAVLLREAGPHIEPAFQRIVEEFYAAIKMSPGASRVIEGPLQLARLELSLHKWLRELFCGVYDDDYLARHSRIGRVHVRIGLDQRYMFAAMSLVRTGLSDALGLSSLAPDVLAGTQRAVDRICDIELAIMLETYRDASMSGLRSEQRALAQDLEQSETEKAELLRTAAKHEALATMGTLTAGLAHEVRNPLNAAKLQLELIGRAAAKLEELGQDNRINDRVDLVNDELSRLSKMLDDFLALARQRHLEPELFELLPLLTEVVELERPVAEAEQIELHVAAFGNSHVFADRARVKQVLMNLLANAVDAMRGTGGEVRLSSEDVGDRVRIVVADTGPGIPIEVRDQLFEPFITSKEAGTGLGLSIVKRIVESHGGEVLVDSDANGTRISFTLEAARD